MSKHRYRIQVTLVVAIQYDCHAVQLQVLARDVLYPVDPTPISAFYFTQTRTLAQSIYTSSALSYTALKTDAHLPVSPGSAHSNPAAIKYKMAASRGLI